MVPRITLTYSYTHVRPTLEGMNKGETIQVIKRKGSILLFQC